MKQIYFFLIFMCLMFKFLNAQPGQVGAFVKDSTLGVYFTEEPGDLDLLGTVRMEYYDGSQHDFLGSLYSSNVYNPVNMSLTDTVYFDLPEADSFQIWGRHFYPGFPGYIDSDRIWVTVPEEPDPVPVVKDAWITGNEVVTIGDGVTEAAVVAVSMSGGYHVINFTEGDTVPLNQLTGHYFIYVVMKDFQVAFYWESGL